MWTARKSEFSPSARRELTDTNSRLMITEEVYENHVKLLNLSEKNFNALKVKNFSYEKNNFFMHSHYSKIRNYVKLLISLNEMEEFKMFQISTCDTIARRRSVEFSGRVQELQNEVNCMNDFKDFQDAESIRSGKSHDTSRPVSFPPHPVKIEI